MRNMIMVKKLKPPKTPPPPPPPIAAPVKEHHKYDLEALNIQQRVLYDQMTPHERDFAFNILRGLSPVAAWKESEYMPQHWFDYSKRAREMLKSELVDRFLKVMRDHSTFDTRVMERDEALQALSSIARGNLMDVLDLEEVETKQGNKYTRYKLKSPNEIDRESFGLVQEISYTEHGLKVKKYSRVDAIKDLRAMQGWDEKKKISVEVDQETINSFSEEKYLQARADMLENDDV